MTIDRQGEVCSDHHFCQPSGPRIRSSPFGDGSVPVKEVWGDEGGITSQYVIGTSILWNCLKKQVYIIQYFSNIFSYEHYFLFSFLCGYRRQGCIRVGCTARKYRVRHFWRRSAELLHQPCQRGCGVTKRLASRRPFQKSGSVRQSLGYPSAPSVRCG